MGKGLLIVFENNNSTKTVNPLKCQDKITQNRGIILEHWNVHDKCLLKAFLKRFECVTIYYYKIYTCICKIYNYELLNIMSNCKCIA